MFPQDQRYDLHKIHRHAAFIATAVMSTFQVSALANADDIAGVFRTSLRSSSATPKVPKESRRNGSRENSTSLRDSAFDSMDSISSWQSTSINSTKRRTTTGTPTRRPRTGLPRSRSRASISGRNSSGFDATLYNDTPLVSRFNQHGEMYTPVSHSWDAFKERLFDSGLSEKYETMTVAETPRSNRRFRSVSPTNVPDDEEDYQETERAKQLLFLQDPLSRSMYKNLETYFDRKTAVRSMFGGGLNGSMSARGFDMNRRSSAQFFQQTDFGIDPPRPQSSLDFGSRRNQDPSRSQSSMGPSSGSFFSRRKKEAPIERSQSAERPEDVKRQIQQRFARINFEEGTTDYDALFTVSEEVTEQLDENGMELQNGSNADKKQPGNQGEGGEATLADSSDVTPKFKLEHLRY